MGRFVSVLGLAAVLGANAIAAQQVDFRASSTTNFLLAEGARAVDLNAASFVAVNPTTLVTAYSQPENTGIRVVINKLPGSESPRSSTQQVESFQVNRFLDTGARFRDPQVAAFSSADSFAVTYECNGLLTPSPDRAVSSRTEHICVSRFDVLGNRIGEESVVTDNGDGPENINPAVGTFKDGGFVVAWIQDSNKVGYQLYDAMGTRVGSNQFTVNDQNIANNAGVGITTLADQSFIVAFVRRFDDGGDVVFESELRAQRISRDGRKLGAQIRVTNNPLLQELDIDNFSIVALPTGGFVAAVHVDDIGVTELIGARVFNLNSRGDLVGSQFVIVNTDVKTDRAEYPSVASVGLDGGFIVSWSEDVRLNDGGQSRTAYVRQFDPQGNPVGPSTAIELNDGDLEGPMETMLHRFPGTNRFALMTVFDTSVQAQRQTLARFFVTQDLTQNPTPSPTPPLVSCRLLGKSQCRASPVCRFTRRMGCTDL